MRAIGKAVVLKLHSAAYYQCPACGFARTEAPHWLEEAYASAITGSDIGYAQRCLSSVTLSRAVFGHLFKKEAQFLDYGGGYGLFVRLMRDNGFDFQSFDPYCDSIFAREHSVRELPNRKFDALTSFETLEHLPDPLAHFDRIFSLTGTLLFSTVLITNPAPPIDQWWYYSPHHGQHVSFYTLQSLELLATKKGLHLVSDHSGLHLLSDQPRAKVLAPILFNSRLRRILALLARRPSLLTSDYQKLEIL